MSQRPSIRAVVAVQEQSLPENEELAFHPLLWLPLYHECRSRAAPIALPLPRHKRVDKKEPDTVGGLGRSVAHHLFRISRESLQACVTRLLLCLVALEHNKGLSMQLDHMQSTSTESIL